MVSKMKTKKEHTRTFNVCDSSGNSYEVVEFTTFMLSVAGGKDNWVVKEIEYKTAEGNNVGHKNHEQFQFPGTSEWLSKC